MFYCSYCHWCPRFHMRRTLRMRAMFKLGVFNALQTRFGPSKYTSLKTTLQNANPNWKWRHHLKSQFNPPATTTNKRRSLPLQEVELDGWFLVFWFFTLYWKHVPHNSCTSLIWVLYFISIFLDWRLGFEPALQLKRWNLRALHHETHMSLGFNLEHWPCWRGWWFRSRLLVHLTSMLSGV